MTDNESVVMVLGLIHPDHLPLQGFVPLLLQAEGRKVAQRFGDEVLVLEPGGQMNVDLDAAVHGILARGQTNYKA